MMIALIGMRGRGPQPECIVGIAELVYAKQERKEFIMTMVMVTNGITVVLNAGRKSQGDGLRR